MPEKDSPEMNRAVFTAYYINQERLLDLFAILNGGYFEYEEIKSVEGGEKQKRGSVKGDVSAGFRLFKLGASVEGDTTKTNSQTLSSEMRKVQTTASMLGAVIDALRSKGLVRNIEGSRPGVFVIAPVRMKINSIKALIEEAKDLLELSSKVVSLGDSASKDKELDSVIKQAQKISGVTKELFNAEEVICETDDFAIIGSLSDKHLYQATRSDIIDADLTCLAQVKRVFPDGTQLMKNTVFTKFMDNKAKASFVEALSALSENESFAYDSTAKTTIEGKPVYQIEIVALYQDIPVQ